MSSAPLTTLPVDVAAPVAIQGEVHSFHHRAAGLLLPGSEVACFDNFPRLASHVGSEGGGLGLMAVENSVAGAILTNYLLLEEHDLTILGETYLRISFDLMTTPHATIDGLQQVRSHPMALAQCRRWFREHAAVNPVETFDTAGAAREVSEAGDESIAALAPRWCAEAYGLQVLAKAVEDNPNNWTRFVLVTHAGSPERGDKTSVAFSLPHATGSLAKVLDRIARAGASLTKIQSLPLVGSPWQYRFFCDFVHEECAAPTDLLNFIDAHTTDLIHLGTYAAGQHHEP